jgi:hypothetical protein
MQYSIEVGEGSHSSRRDGRGVAVAAAAELAMNGWGDGNVNEAERNTSRGKPVTTCALSTGEAGGADVAGRMSAVTRVVWPSTRAA